MTYKMKEVSHIVGVSTRTLMRWFKEGKIQEVDRDRNNHRVFDQQDIEQIQQFANRRVAAPGKLQPLLFQQGVGS